MIVPILTLYKLQRLAKGSFLFIPEIEIRTKEDSEKPDFEIDICCIVDGEIIMGECKRNNKLTDKIIEKYTQLVNNIGANKVIFSTFCNSWSKTAQSKITQAFKRLRIKIQLLTKSDLLTM